MFLCIDTFIISSRGLIIMYYPQQNSILVYICPPLIAQLIASICRLDIGISYLIDSLIANFEVITTVGAHITFSFLSMLRRLLDALDLVLLDQVQLERA